jgi:hypothetical protein
MNAICTAVSRIVDLHRQMLRLIWPDTRYAERCNGICPARLLALRFPCRETRTVIFNDRVMTKRGSN